ncbi:LexA family protein [Burkholderia vietnamiensis]|uniref:LexA family protein n=1 Tax=Burkholderia vietnamiensis TaxID=60552 RepID=UPI0007537093|nr:S24 family peptidase [Burkholderia vietnamiensis]KVE21812.1 peptidase S24 [Burkholderia vietnamiensis]MDN8067024.1 S24 family peptidase [Burkholderia vietnamiensis]
MARPNNDQVHLRRLRDTYAQMGCMPSYSQISKVLGFNTKNAAFKLAQRLIASGHLARAVGGRLAPGPAFFTLELSDDEVRAGLGADGDATGLVQAQALDQLLMARPSKTVLVKVRGDSMLDAGILSGDVAVVETSLQASTGDIVVAEIDGSQTIKEFRNERGQPRLVSHGIDSQAVTPEKTLNIIGVVRGIVRSYKPPTYGGAKLKKQGKFR